MNKNVTASVTCNRLLILSKPSSITMLCLLDFSVSGTITSTPGWPAVPNKVFVEDHGILSMISLQES